MMPTLISFYALAFDPSKLKVVNEADKTINLAAVKKHAKRFVTAMASGSKVLLKAGPEAGATVGGAESLVLYSFKNHYVPSDRLLADMICIVKANKYVLIKIMEAAPEAITLGYFHVAHDKLSEAPDPPPMQPTRITIVEARAFIENYAALLHKPITAAVAAGNPDDPVDEDDGGLL